ncbi:hypothetical protein HS961_17340 [Comamonas piscis]|uniref:Lipoprotein n=1 Tax=Comamonas piscis TaxID=1562974 RepID=A0A7G5EKD0_9BURK|nr:hypothetical protein [Comamonas piscis]QMV74455.1 hypothetical protein HS961_17340 [Comamonas piscis]WSO32910.1 hypothetical protein VUJ63_17395 [Comamonas piscis]
MRTPYLFACLPLALALSACQEDKPTAATQAAAKPTFTAPSVDISTPDKAVKSWWAVVDSKFNLRYQECTQAASAEQTALLQAQLRVATGAVKSYMQHDKECTLFTYDRRIDRVDMETESRALVVTTIKNSTRPKEGQSIANRTLEAATDGVEYRYVLSRENDGWRVEDIYQYDDLLKAMGRDPWKQEYQRAPPDLYLLIYNQ